MNDERPIENLLRRAAQKRSAEAGPPPELHPANRRLLQAEVAKQFSRPAVPEPEPSLLATWWALIQRRWVYAVVVLPVIGLFAFVLIPVLTASKPKLSLAQNETSNRPVVAPVSSPAVALEPTPAVARSASDDYAAKASGGGNFPPTPESSGALSAAAPTVASRTAPATARNLAKADATAKTKAAIAGRTAPATRGPVGGEMEAVVTRPATVTSATLAETAIPVAPMEALTDSAVSPGRRDATSSDRKLGAVVSPRPVAADSAVPPLSVVEQEQKIIAAVAADKLGATSEEVKKERPIFNSQAFSNVNADPAPKGSRGGLPLPVLVKFQVQQQGRDLRIVDGDGSVYNGVLDEANTVYSQVAERHYEKQALANDNNIKFQAPKAQTSNLNQKDAPYYFYRVAGTNRTLNQPVVFSWNFLPTNEAVAANQLNYQQVLQKTDAAKLPSQFPDLLNNSYINGRAEFGPGREVEVNAVPVKR